MTTRLGPNIHSIGLKDKAKLLRWLVALQPRATLVMDNHALAKEIKLLIPSCAVVHRSYKEGDHAFHHTMSVQAFYDHYARWGEGGIIVQALNEPSPDNNRVWDWRRMADWLANLMDRFGQAGIALCVGNFGTGSPHESLPSLTALDPLWAALKRWNSLHYLGTHAYMTYRGGTYTDESHQHDVIPWRIGREAKFIIPYCQERYGFAPRVIQTEHGTDVSFFSGDDPSKSGWKSVPWTENQYADELIKADQYDNHPWLIGRCIFSYGNSGGWEKYDIEDAAPLHDRLTAYSKSLEVSMHQQVTVKLNPATPPINLRNTPAGVDIGDIPDGRIVTDTGERQQAIYEGDSYTWARVISSTQTGWIALTPRVALVDVVAEPPVVIPPPAPEPEPIPAPPPESTVPIPPAFYPVLAYLDADELAQGIGYVQQIRAGLLGLADLLGKVEDRARQVKETN